MASRDAKIWAAVRNFLEGYADLPANVVYGGEAFNAPDPQAPYLIVDDFRFQPERTYFTGRNWNTGNLMIHCMIPLEWTYTQSIEYAGRIADYFAEDSLMVFDDVSLQVAQQPTISGAGYRDGSHYRIPLVVPWEGRV